MPTFYIYRLGDGNKVARLCKQVQKLVAHHGEPKFPCNNMILWLDEIHCEGENIFMDVALLWYQVSDYFLPLLPWCFPK
jgi:hypothetical protein